MIDLVEITYPAPGTCVIALQGEHDRVTEERRARLFREALALNDLVVIDVSQADFVDSSFLRNVLVADRRANEQKKVLRVQMGTAPIVRRAFEVSGVLDCLTVVHCRDDALARPGSRHAVYEAAVR